jgi:hypothetical protein
MWNRPLVAGAAVVVVAGLVLSAVLFVWHSTDAPGGLMPSSCWGAQALV